MTAIWNSLVSEPTKTIDKYLMEIVNELQTNLTSNQWRVRESCCGALQDLVRGRSMSGAALQVLPDIWTDLFRVRSFNNVLGIMVTKEKTVFQSSYTLVRIAPI